MKYLVSLLAGVVFLLTTFASCDTPSKDKAIAEQCCSKNATCTGSKSCSACKNCKYCKHCSKDGGTCGVCK